MTQSNKIVPASLILTILLVQACPARNTANVFHEDFETPSSVAQWQVKGGNWAVESGAYCQRSASGPGRRLAMVTVPFTPDLVTVDVTPIQKNDYGFASFGFVIKYVDSSNYTFIRFGDYGGLSLCSSQNGKSNILTMGTFTPELGKTYQIGLVYKQDRIAVFLDGTLRCTLSARLTDKPGRLGFYAGSPCRFDNFNACTGDGVLKDFASNIDRKIREKGTSPLAEKPRKTLTDSPQLELAFATYRPAMKLPGTCLPSGGGIYLYVRNRGKGPAELRRILIDGVDVDLLKHSVSWWRQRPAILKPGDVGEILIRLSALTAKTAVALLENPAARPKLPVTIEPYGGKALHVEVPIGAESKPLQVNYVGFDPSLQRVYIYVQQNESDNGEHTAALRLNHVSINGRDVTVQAQLGREKILADVTPIVVDLPWPLRKGEPVVVCVGTREGVWAGHAVRAFPGKFHIQVTLMGEQTRPDAVEDIWRHNATCIGMCGPRKEPLLEAKSLGLTAFHYGLGGLASLRRFDNPYYPTISGFWLDEMDKFPVRHTFDVIGECERAYAEEGKFIPLQMINLCQGRVPGAVDFYELSDAACSACGFHGGSLGSQFGRLSGLPDREYRAARRPFTPYLRNAEVPVVVDPTTQELIGREVKHRRCIAPKEERWMTYGCLIQGAKGFMHWNYGSGLLRPPNWFSKDQWVIRAALGGTLGHKPHGYQIPDDVTDDLRAVWDEIGRINVELRAVGPLVAVSDVSKLARVVAVTPELSPWGEPAAEAAALVCGLDSIVLVVLNHNLKTHWKADSDQGLDTYDPVDATVELTLPPWLVPKHVFRVRYDGVHRLEPKHVDDRLVFRFGKLDVSEVVVITDRNGLMESTAATVEKLHARLLTGTSKGKSGK